MSQEQVFLSEGNVVVSTTRFTHGGQTYAMANVTSVRAGASSVGMPIVIALLGVVLIAARLPWLGVVLFVSGVLGAIFRQRFVVLHTAGAEQRALKSMSKAFVERVVAAVNQAIIARG